MSNWATYEEWEKDDYIREWQDLVDIEAEKKEMI